jgi:hypothetical protein
MGVSDEEVVSMDGRIAQVRSQLLEAETQTAGAEIVAVLKSIHEPVIDQRLEELQMIADGYPACDGLTLFCGGTK